MAQYKIHFKDKIYLVQANNPHEAVNTLACALYDERFPLVYYKILKNLGYTHDDWINWSLSTAKRVIENKTSKNSSAEHNNSNKSKSIEQKPVNHIYKYTVNGNIIYMYEPKPKAFKDTFEKAKSSVDKTARWRVSSEYDEQQYSDMKRYSTKGGSCVAIHDGDIVSVCKNDTDTKVKGKDLLSIAVKNGGNKLDAFGGLFGFYIKCGFTPVSWTKFDETYAPDGWDKTRDKPEPVVFFRLQRAGDKVYKDLDDFIKSVSAEKDYDTAKAKRDKDLEK